ncbi:pilus assembly protein [Marinimicrobium alkaliphilum]|uniref:pilus assembly protein n=1 Tax=Marinimicrobium alkaliphilum TaxID=2202654 RepID=UPI000DBA990E|nr:PilC/PilY family type IV pilus protein [Marinimicrobium alkaliphilum]
MISTKIYSNALKALTVVGLYAAAAMPVLALELSQSPLFLAQPVRPLVMLNMSNDHQLYFKAYDDYSDLTGDGRPDTTYVHDYDYYGYFDSGKCYTHTSNRFVPSRVVDEDGYCNHGTAANEWSGNFLNWATMTRMDAVRKILYGGLRHVDTATETVLERAFIPHDAHSFSKYYNGTDIGRLTPFGSVTSGLTETKETGITICNTTEGSGFSQNVTNPPLLRVAEGNFSLWNSNERWQCRWREDMTSAGQGVNDNDPDITGIYAYSDSPQRSEDSLGEGDYIVRVKACVPGLEEEDCRSYPSGNTKPSGLLQEYGERGRILFGLMTGSYGRNKSGGVLRKNIGDLQDEIYSETDGRFKASPESGGIVDTLNRLRIFGYNYNSGEYSGGTASDNCPFGLTGFDDGDCSNWGNPQSEIYLESLRYLAGKAPNSGFVTDDSDYIPGLVTADWNDPISTANFCAPLSVIQFNASKSSFDDDVSGVGDLGLTDVRGWVNRIGSAESIHGNQFFVGSSGTQDDQLCTPKLISNLGDVHGICPDAPRLEGTYNIAGLAYYARTNSIRTDRQGEQTVRTYGVALSSATPTLTVPVPGSAGRTISILPACQNLQTSGGVREGNCAIVDFRIIEENRGALVNSGKVYINWEAAEQGGDHDSDMWGVLEYEVVPGRVEVTTNVMQQSSGRPLGFGYVISGTTSDGFQVHSGINNFTRPAATAPVGAVINGCNNCTVGNTETTNTYIVGDSLANQLQSPLYYAAKWGGFSDDAMEESDIAESEPETYFFATEPRQLQRDLDDALRQVADEVGSASAVATNSTRLGTDTVIYQALFDSSDWTGELQAIELREDGSLGDVKWSTRDTFQPINHNVRRIFTHDGDSGVEFQVQNLNDQQRTLLAGGEDNLILAEARLNWARGQAVPGMRERSGILGDIINSDPAFSGTNSFRFYGLDEDLGGPEYRDFVDTKQGRPEVVFVNSNGGMLHAFDAQTGEELFAYVPSTVYEQLYNMSLPNYGAPSNPHQYSVDGQIFVGDAYIDDQWRTLLVGALGAGGRGLFVLDVTDPENFSANDVLFEITPTTHADVGQVIGQSLVAPTSDGWYIFFGNGYNSVDHQAKLMMVKVDNGGATVRTYGSSTNGSDADPNGMAGPALMVNGVGEVTHAYAGDYHGNLWKFSFTHSNTGNWGAAYSQGQNPLPMFTAIDRNNRRQPITASPTLGVNAQKNNAVMVYFGTGSYLTDADNAPGNVIHSFYALADTGNRITARTQLMEKSIIYEGDPLPSMDGDLDRLTRQVDKNDDDTWWENKSGWFLDLIGPDTTVPTGERVVSRPLLMYDRLIFPTLITNDDPCSYGGSGWLMELIAVGDRYVGHSILGADGLALDYAVMGLPPLIRGGESGYLPLSDISGDITVQEGSMPAGAVGRQSWRQLR